MSCGSPPARSRSDRLRWQLERRRRRAHQAVQPASSPAALARANLADLIPEPPLAGSALAAAAPTRRCWWRPLRGRGHGALRHRRCRRRLPAAMKRWPPGRSVAGSHARWSAPPGGKATHTWSGGGGCVGQDRRAAASAAAVVSAALGNWIPPGPSLRRAGVLLHCAERAHARPSSPSRLPRHRGSLREWAGCRPSWPPRWRAREPATVRRRLAFGGHATAAPAALGRLAAAASAASAWCSGSRPRALLLAVGFAFGARRGCSRCSPGPGASSSSPIGAFPPVHRGGAAGEGGHRPDAQTSMGFLLRC